MRSRFVVVVLGFLASAVACGGGGGMRGVGDGSADGRASDGLVLARDASRFTEIGTGTDGAGGRLGTDGRLGAVDAGDGALSPPDLGAAPPDAHLAVADGDLPTRPDAPMEARAPGAEAGVSVAVDVGGPPDVAVDAAPLQGDVGVVSPPDVAVDAALNSDLAFPPLSLECKVPECWARLMRDCQPVGTCTAQSADGYENLCFADAVKVVATVDEIAGRMITTVSKGTQICYQVDWDLAAGATSGATSTGVIKNGSGVIVATIGDDVSGFSVMTCTGEQPVVLSEACDFVGLAPCEAGACGP